MPEKKPQIIFMKGSPYYLIDVPALVNIHGELYPLTPVTALCRCGASKNKPYCDNSHVAINFVGEKSPDRVPDRTKEYFGENITVVDNRGVCDHNGACINMLPSVFRLKKRPWIFPDGATPEEIIDMIRYCPTGSLSYNIGGIRYQAYERPPLMRINPGGPINVEGGIELKDDEGTVPECAEHYSLCRCGESKNTPFCDGSHYYVNFDHITVAEKGDPDLKSAPKE
jgi:CDGSH-type Zn-finger protein/ferredoxin